MGVNGAKTTPSALSSSMLPYLLGELLSKANEALVQPIRSVNTTQAEHRHYQRRQEERAPNMVNRMRYHAMLT